MNCDKCGKAITPDDKFCPHCGAPQNQAPANLVNCPKCAHANLPTASFCEKCGSSLAEKAPADNQNKGPKTFASTGNYSGKMIKGKTSKSWKVLIYVILSVVVIGAIALVVWFQRDPAAGEKLKSFAGGLLIVAIFLFFVFRGKKGKRRIRRSGDDDQFDHDDDDHDYDSDDGGDDD
jgi:uncharacterized membrane protein YvbJ